MTEILKPYHTETSPPSESIHERGGLGPSGWEEVLRNIPQQNDPISTRLRGYGDAAISGKIQDRNFEHRQYLGRRHWKRIEDIFNGPYFIPTVKQGLLWRKTQEPGIKNEISDYALLESRASFTLNDYASNLNKSVPIVPKSRWGRQPDLTRAEWDPEQNNWRGKEHYHHYTPGGWYHGMVYSEYIETVDEWHTSEITLDEEHLEQLKNAYFLANEDVTDLAHTPPEELEKLMFNKARQNQKEVAEKLLEVNKYDFRDWLEIYIPLGNKHIRASALKLQNAYQMHFDVVPYIVMAGYMQSGYDGKGFRVCAVRPHYFTSSHSDYKGNVDTEDRLPTRSIPLLEKEI